MSGTGFDPTVCADDSAGLSGYGIYWRDGASVYDRMSVCIFVGNTTDRKDGAGIFLRTGGEACMY